MGWNQMGRSKMGWNRLGANKKDDFTIFRLGSEDKKSLCKQNAQKSLAYCPSGVSQASNACRDYIMGVLGAKMPGTPEPF